MKDRSLIDIVIQHIKPKRTISLKYNGKYYEKKPRVNDLFSLQWKWVIKIRQQVQQPTFKAIQEIIRGLYPIQTDEQFFNCSVFDVFAAYAWIIEEVDGIYQVEVEKIYKKPTQKQINAGIEEFNQLDDVPAIDGIAGGYVTKWDEVLEMPYGKVLRKMLLNKIQNEYNERYHKQK